MALAIVAALQLCSVPAHSQRTRAQTLGRAVATLRDDFSSVLSCRTFGDTLLMLSDYIERKLWLADWRTGRSIEVGRTGDGPGEYRSPGFIAALRGDTTLVTDLMDGRWTFLNGRDFLRQESRADTRPAGLGAEVTASRSGAILGARGFNSPPPRTRRPLGGQRENSDSQFIVLAPRASSQLDTVARSRGGYRVPAREVVKVATDGTPVTYILMSGMLTFDQAVMMDDGSIAIVIETPFSVAFLSAPYRSASRYQLPFPKIPVGARERNFMHSWTARQNPWGKLNYSAEETNWPAFVPPFLTHSVLPVPGGRVAIRLTPTPQQPHTRYFIVDRSGTIDELTMGQDQRAACFGNGFVVVETRDDDGLLKVSRHRTR